VHPELMLVQFPHPGSEHQPRGPIMDWNRREHARKFLRANGRYLMDGAVQSGPLAFWGEWEPQSTVAELPAGDHGFPRYLHDPFWQRLRHQGKLQNTDPLVFGDSFLYSNCRQLHNSKLRRLAPGSLVLFGSKLDHEFVLDTVFVVSDEGQAFSPASAASVRTEDWIQAVVFEPLSRSAGPLDGAFRLYRGRMYDDSPDRPFSFVPCRPFRSGSAGFARPVVQLDRRWVTPNLAMGAKATPTTEAELSTIWGDLVGQVNLAGLALGISLEPPRQFVEA
jgi:hypothetical protein